MKTCFIFETPYAVSAVEKKARKARAAPSSEFLFRGFSDGPPPEFEQSIETRRFFMSKPKRPQNSPYAVELKAGQKYAWCVCGASSSQPFCDGAHRGTDFQPLVFTAEVTQSAYLCGCKSTSGAPFCDGSHTKTAQ